MTPDEVTQRYDLDWLAFCYVTGELSATEMTAFEERLSTDEGACEAVARATELNLAVAVVMSDSARSSGGSPELQSIAGAGEPPELRAAEVTVLSRRKDLVTPSRWTGAVLTLIAASAIAAMMIVAIGSSILTGNKVAKRDGADRLVAAWTQGEAARNEVADDNDSLDADDDDLDPPDWMLAAVTEEEQAKLLPGDDAREVREN